MPKQHTLFGRPIPRFTIRRLTVLLFGISVFALAAISTLPSSIPSSPSQSAYHDRKISVANIGDKFSKSVLNPFRQPSHPPPRQKNDTYDGSSWWADWKWLSVPFSSSLTLEEDRALLPPLRDRPLIFCYYDATLKKSREEKDAESELLLTWRRAWWAQGFRPTIISASEAMNNPKYQEFQRMGAEPDMKADMMRWLAWEATGAGLLAEYTVLPMGPSDDPLLSYLRRGEYPQLTRWKGLDGALLAGMETDVNKAIRSLMDRMPVPEKSVMAALGQGSFKVDTSSKALGYYSSKVVEKSYTKVGKHLANGKAKGLGYLNRLINSHLQIAWQNSFPDGIEVLKPLPEHTTTMVSGAFKLAHSLASCPDSPIPSSCPPQLRRCTPCIADSTLMKITTPSQYRNSSRAYTIGTVPHPWTLASLHNMKDSLDVAWIRRESPRDAWLAAVMQDLLGDKVSGDRRVMRFKQAVADEHATAHALWLTAEADIPNDLEWHFGFAIPKQPGEDTKHDHPKDDDKTQKEEKTKKEERTKKDEKTERGKKIEGEEKTSDDDQTDTPAPLSPEEALAKEPILLNRAKRIVALTKATTETRLRASLEAWNLADTEAWKFCRAFLARRSMERVQWEKDEEKYSGGAGSEKGRSSWSRWRDSKEKKED
ncbi:Fc.00g029080.m01.CDS01 [Cosmosporella sp. VM-42]